MEKLYEMVDEYIDYVNGIDDKIIAVAQFDHIPGVFKKELTHDFNGYTANYKVTVNESKLALTNGTPLTIHDVMTDTLAYISGSLVITAEDANGNLITEDAYAGKTIDVKGIVDCYEGKYQIKVFSQNEITVH